MTKLPPGVNRISADEYIREFDEGSEAGQDNPFLKALPMDRFLAYEFKPVRWLVKDLVPAEGLVMMYGKPKAGKSSVARDLAYCIATGQPFMSRQTTQGRVLYLAFEEHPGHLQDQWNRMALPDDCAGNLYMYFGGPSMSDDSIAQLEEAVVQFRPDIVFADTLFRLIRVQDENGYAEASRTMDPLLKIARDLGSTIVALHHERKSGGENGDGMLGSTAFFGSVDVAIKIERDNASGRRYISSDHRVGVPLPKTELHMDPETGQFGIGKTAEESSVEQMHEGMRRVLAQQPGRTMERGALEKAVGGNKNVFTRASHNLPADIGKTGGGKKGDPLVFELL